MEKKGNLLNQMAIIVDLIENMNLNYESSTMVFQLSDDEYKKTFNYFNLKNNGRKITIGDTFTIKMGIVDVIFNKSNDETIQSS